MTQTFHAWNPTSGEPIDRSYDVSTRSELLACAEHAPQSLEPAAAAAFLEAYGETLDLDREAITATAHEETGLALEPRLRTIEFDRMLLQLREAAVAAADESRTSWRAPLIDEATNVRSCFGPLGGPVFIMGPNNFPLAYNALCGGDFAGAIAAGNPVIAKGHPSHPETCQRIALCAAKALASCGLDDSIVQFFQHCAPEDGLALIGHDRVKAVAFTGSRRSGLAIKDAADRCGTPAYLEMSSVNPVFFLPGATSTESAQEWAGSITLGGGQFCTKPGLAFTCSRSFANEVKSALEGLGDAIQLTADHTDLIDRFTAVGATVVCGGPSDGFRWPPTLLKVDGTVFEANAEVLSTECFGPVALLVEVDGLAQMERIASRVEGQLTACVYAGKGDDPARLFTLLRSACGRLLQNKMPTGVAVVSSMVHGGPFPATGHPGFTAVGMPTSVVRFAARHCYDNVADAYVPLCLR